MALYTVHKNDMDSNMERATLTDSIPQTAPAVPGRSASPFEFRTQVPVASWDSNPSYPPVTSQKFILPMCPLKRLRAWHPAAKGTAAHYAGKLLRDFPELVDVEENEMEKVLKRMRRKGEAEP
jgi:hypothetical protein